MNHDSSGQPKQRPHYDVALYVELYRHVEPRIREVARAVHAGRLSPAVGRERVAEFLAALNARYRQEATRAAGA